MTSYSGSSSGIAVANAQDVQPKARGLTIEECLKMISTETDTEFDWDETDPTIAEIATNLWDDANSFEWKKAYLAEQTDDNEKYPYLLCHIGKDSTTGNNLSGYRRQLALAQAVNYVEGDSNDKLYFRPLYNKPEYLCVYGQLHATTALNITGDEFIVQPIVPSLKYMKGSVDGMEEMMEEYNEDKKNKAQQTNEDNEYHPSLDIVLCPGVGLSDNAAAEATATADSNTASWEDIPEEIASEITQQLVPQTITVDDLINNNDTITKIPISETYYLTSQSYIDTASELGQEYTDRSTKWRSAIQDYQESGICNEMYTQRLRWKISPASVDNAQYQSSILNVEYYNTTGNTTYDTGCFLTLSLGIVANPSVCSLEMKQKVEVQNKVIQWLTQSEIEDERPFFDAGLNGEGQVVTVSDTGVDRDHCYFVDKENTPSSWSVNLNARKLAQYVDFVDQRDYEYGHGTHVAGTIAGKRIDANGMADGIAPSAKLAVADIGDMNGGLALPLDRSLLNVGRPYSKIHSASWGSELNFYTTQSHNFDQYMYDNDDMLIVVAAGNSGYGDAKHTVGSPATAKNIISVGAHHNTGKSTPKHGLGPSYIADFSSRGPTSDGRMKPDMLAPGKAVLSAGAKPNEVGECDPDKVPGANGKSAGVLSLQGTSMATPVVAGTAAIIRQYFEQGYYPTGVKEERNVVENPSGALVKAVLMNGAQFMRGVDNGVDGVTEIKPYDFNQGFGRLALQYSVYIPGKTDVQLSAWDRQVVYDQESQSYGITIDKSAGCTHEDLSVTLVWTEPGSSPGCLSCVLNDLDLTVEYGGKTFYPNNLGRPDRENNAERVIISGVNNGAEVTITVTGSNLMQQYQLYSLVATGCFGGVANQNFASECSAFECDDSQDKRMATILMAIFIPLGVLLLCCAVGWGRRKAGQRANDNYDDGQQDQY